MSDQDENCPGCGEPLDDESGGLERVGDSVLVPCSVGEDDELGMQLLRHPDTGEMRILVEAIEYIPADDALEDLRDAVLELTAEMMKSGKVLLLPAQARIFAAALLNAADQADGIEFTTGDWNMKEIDDGPAA